MERGLQTARWAQDDDLGPQNPPSAKSVLPSKETSSGPEAEYVAISEMTIPLHVLD